MGAVQPPEIAEPPVQFTEESVKNCGETCAAAYRDYALKNMYTPAQAWDIIAKAMRDWGTDDADIEELKLIMAGWQSATVEFVTHLYKRYDRRCPFMEVLHDLDGTNEAVELRARR